MSPIIRSNRVEVCPICTIGRSGPRGKVRGQGARHEDELDPRLTTALREVFAWGGDVSVATLARRSGAHARTLARLFHRWAGLSPKRFVRIVRLQTALRACRTA